MNNIFSKTFQDKKMFIIGWFIGFAALAALMVTFYPAMHQDGTVDKLLANMPKAFEGLVGNLADLKEFPTYLASQLFDIRISLLAGIMATLLALGISATEEENGQFRTLLSLPISRTKLFIQKWLAMVSIIFITLLGTVASIFTLQGTVNASIDIGTMFNLYMMTGLVISTLATITFSIAMATGKRSLAMLLGIVVVAGSFIISTFGASVDWIKNFEWVSIFHYFPASEVARSGIVWSDVMMLISVIVISLFVAIITFRQRDVN